jgi:hypothetical protein
LKVIALVAILITISFRSAFCAPKADALVSQDYRERDEALKLIPTLSLDERQTLAQQLVPKLSGSDITVGGFASEALGRLGQDAIPALLDQIKINPNDALTISSLSRLDSSALPLVQTLLHRDDDLLKHSALRILAAMKPGTAIGAGTDVTALLFGENDDLRLHAMEVFAGIAQRLPSWQRYKLTDSLPNIVHALEAESQAIRDAGVDTLGAMGKMADQAVEKLRMGLEDTSRPLNKPKVIAALRAINTQAAWDVLASIGVPEPSDGEHEPKGDYFSGSPGHRVPSPGIWRKPDSE